MTARFADVLEISLTMAVVLAVLLGLRPLLKEKLRTKAFYWVWLLAALRLCIPFNVSLPQAPVTVEAAPRQALVRVDTHRTNPGGTEYRVMTPLEAEQAQSAAYSAPREPDAPSAADRYTTVLTAGQLLALLWLAGAGRPWPGIWQNTSASACGCAAGVLRRRTPPCWRGLRRRRRSWG